ncbi:Long-chain-fatty-acid--CoA ligase FadD15 [Variovorax sp. PBL-H6]|uniref:AMP-dependent synthetase/ligase n=1 Tax=Variovorax sp. PBL-H6 TaxID=434009 RepID=UPI0013198FED|nr:AMP-binding protein [Variovorax sp. PBL-H6]VTU24892.1 Long-chain-fatty-acid--CoA ligase FadD15 [Variovorax sp. PBL-H6]
MSPSRGTLPAEFSRLVAERPDATVMRQKELGVWRQYSARDVGEQVARIAAGLSALGVRPGEVVAIAAGTCKEWLLADLGAQTAGATVAGVHVTDAAHETCRELAALEARVLFIEGEEQFETLLEAGELARLEHIVVFRADGLRRAGDPRLVSLHDLQARGQQALAADASLVQRLLSSRTAADAAMIVYTSGATGRSKGVLLSHRAVLTAAGALQTALAGTGAMAGERVLFQPLSHVMERIGGMYASLMQGAVLNFVESQDTVFDNLREVQPDVIFAVPRIWERLHSSLVVTLHEATRLQQWAYERTLRLGESVARAREQGTTASAATRLLHAVGNRLVLGNLRRMMGLDRLRVGISGGAPLSPSLVRWYRGMGIDLRHAWGLTEMAGYAAIAEAGDAPESAGRPLPGVEVRLSEQAEILVKGASLLSGYRGSAPRSQSQWQSQSQSQPELDDGWLRTGDIGRIDASGRLEIVGRLDEVIAMATGRQVFPMELENRIKSSPYVADVVVVGDGRPQLSCLVMIDHEAVEQWAQERQVAFSDFRSLCASPEVLKLIGDELKRTGAQAEQGVIAFRLIDTPADGDEASLTPAMKLKRWRIVDRYSGAIDSMYAVAAA